MDVKVIKGVYLTFILDPCSFLFDQHILMQRALPAGSRDLIFM